jgi:hypothetical membrane protein
MSDNDIATRTSAATLRILGVAGVALFAAIVLLLPAIKDDYSPVRDAISEGALGRYGYFQVAAFFGLGIGSISLAAWLLRDLRTGAVGLLTGVSGVCMLVAGSFTADRMDGPSTTVHGTVHMVAAALAFAAVISAMLLSARQFRNSQFLRPLARPSLALGLVALVLFVIASADIGPFGLIQRANVAVVLAWLIAVALRGRSPQLL